MRLTLLANTVRGPIAQDTTISSELIDEATSKIEGTRLRLRVEVL